MLARTVSTRVLGNRCFCSQLPVFPVGSHTLSYRGRLCFEWGLQLSPSRGRWCLCQKSQGPLVNGCTEAETRSSECALCRLCTHLCTCVPDLSGPPCRWMAQQWWQIVSVYLRERGLPVGTSIPFPVGSGLPLSEMGHFCCFILLSATLVSPGWLQSGLVLVPLCTVP